MLFIKSLVSCQLLIRFMATGRHLDRKGQNCRIPPDVRHSRRTWRWEECLEESSAWVRRAVEGGDAGNEGGASAVSSFCGGRLGRWLGRLRKQYPLWAQRWGTHLRSLLLHLKRVNRGDNYRRMMNAEKISNYRSFKLKREPNNAKVQMCWRYEWYFSCNLS